MIQLTEYGRLECQIVRKTIDVNEQVFSVGLWRVVSVVASFIQSQII